MEHFPDAKKSGEGWLVVCPAHDDHKPSLHVTPGQDGRVLINCFVGCKAESVVSALGLRMADLMPEDDSARSRPAQSETTTYVTRTFATAQDAVHESERKKGRPKDSFWTYTDAAGAPIGLILRWNEEGGGKDIRQISRNGVGWKLESMEKPRPLYRLHELAAAKIVVLCEGEKAADAARSLGFVATTWPGGSSAVRFSDFTSLAGKEVWAFPDNDDTGKKCIAIAETALKGLNPPATVKVVELPGLPPKGDMVEWIEAHGDAAEPEQMKREIEALVRKKNGYGFKFAPITSAEFQASLCRPEWIIKRLLVKGQPAIIGGPKKSMKTSFLVDLVVSLGTASAFLGTFDIDQKMRVAMLSGESGEFTLRETAIRVCEAKGIQLKEVDALWQFTLPQLSKIVDVAELARGLAEHKVEVVILDPLYLSLLAGVSGGAQASNLFEMGPLFLRITQACLEVGVTPILAHHFKQNRAEPYAEPQLEDLSFAGIQEFSRQWILLGRREKYHSGTGEHHLWLSAGGSVGHGGLWAVDVDEGMIDENFAGRRWEVRVSTADDERRASALSNEQLKKEIALKEKEEFETKVMQALDRIDPFGKGVSKKELQQASELPRSKFENTVSGLTGRLIEKCEVPVTLGKGAVRACEGFRRKKTV